MHTSKRIIVENIQCTHLEKLKQENIIFKMILFYSPALDGNRITNMLLKFETTGCFFNKQTKHWSIDFFFFNNMKIYVSK